MILTNNLYQFFGSTEPLTLNELKKRYYSFSKLMHPDINNSDKFICSFFTQMTSIYNKLLDKNFKNHYDKIVRSQIKNIEYLDSSNISILDLIDSSFVSNNDKLSIAFIELENSFNETKYKNIIFYLLKLSPKYPLKLINKLEKVTNRKFYDIYFDILFEILLNHKSCFSDYVKYFNGLKLKKKDKEILSMCVNYNLNMLNILELKKLSLKYDIRLLHLLMINTI